jgi:hypothetical protein
LAHFPELQGEHLSLFTQIILIFANKLKFQHGGRVFNPDPSGNGTGTGIGSFDQLFKKGTVSRVFFTSVFFKTNNPSLVHDYHPKIFSNLVPISQGYSRISSTMPHSAVWHSAESIFVVEYLRQYESLFETALAYESRGTGILSDEKIRSQISRETVLLKHSTGIIFMQRCGGEQ